MVWGTLKNHRMEIKYEIVPEDITYYSKEAAAGTKLHSIRAFIFCAVVMLFIFSDIILAILSITKADGSVLITSVLPRALIGLTIMGISYVTLITISKREARKVATTSGKNGVFCEHTVTLDENGFTETTDVNRSFHAWEGVEKITGTPSYLTIHIRLGAGYFIPKRAFSSIEEQRAFVATVQKRLPPTAPIGPATIRAGS